MNFDVLVDDNNRVAEGIFFTGYIFIDGCFVEKNDVGNRIIDIIDDDIEKLTDRINGSFYILYIKKNEFATAIVSPDQLNELFYKQNSDKFLFSDRTDSFQNCIIDRQGANQLLASGHTHLEKSLYEGVLCMRGGCVYRFTSEGVQFRRYFTYAVSDREINYDSKLENYASILIERAFNRMIDSLGNRTVVIPLSGGYDSRLILSILIKKTYPKIITFTYGKPSNKEVIIAERIARKLNVKWYNIEYSDTFISSEEDTEMLNDYILFASNGRSSAHLHEFYAVKYLKDNGLLPEESIFIPGHGGDFIGGSQFVKSFSPYLLRENISKAYLRCRYNLFKLKKKDYQKELVSLQHKVACYSGDDMPYSIFEDLDCAGKHSRFTVNASKVFTFFGYDVRLPFWDIELLTFFKSIPRDKKVSKVFYVNLLNKRYFNALNVNYSDELQPTVYKTKIQGIKEKVKHLLPKCVLKHYLLKNDWVNYTRITQPLVSKMKEVSYPFKFTFLSYNSIVPQYILFLIKTKKQDIDQVNKKLP